MPQWLNEITPQFPPVSTANEEGLLAIGGNLQVETLVSAYQKGIFPWFEEDTPILWWSPNPRLVLAPSTYHVSKSLVRLLRKNHWKICLNSNFSKVISNCSRPRTPSDTQHSTWITSTMQTAYVALHMAGLAHSVEVFEEDELVGGLYGVAIGRIFFGESMFSLTNNASKVALYHLCKYLHKYHFPLIDCQIESAHLISLGAKKMPRIDFIKQIQIAIKISTDPSIWQPKILA